MRGGSLKRTPPGTLTILYSITRLSHKTYTVVLNLDLLECHPLASRPARIKNSVKGAEQASINPTLRCLKATVITFKVPRRPPYIPPP
jgi:hypothetical protein